MQTVRLRRDRRTGRKLVSRQIRSLWRHDSWQSRWRRGVEAQRLVDHLAEVGQLSTLCVREVPRESLELGRQSMSNRIIAADTVRQIRQGHRRGVAARDDVSHRIVQDLEVGEAVFTGIEKPREEAWFGLLRVVGHELLVSLY